jgi:hypothetical protein
MGAVQSYFGGERAAGILLAAAIGPLFLLAAWWVWRSEVGGFALALAVPCLLMGLAGTVGGGVLARQSGQRIEAFAARAESDAAGLARDEGVRMEKVNANWPRLKAAWAALAAIGFGLALFGVRGWMTGLGLALTVLATLALVVDVFAERRAETYTVALERAASGAVETE